MNDEALESAPVGRPHDQLGTRPSHQHDLPDRWCLGLAHPYMQRLIFLAGEMERGAVDLGDCRPSASQADK